MSALALAISYCVVLSIGIALGELNNERRRARRRDALRSERLERARGNSRRRDEWQKRVEHTRQEGA